MNSVDDNVKDISEKYYHNNPTDDNRALLLHLKDKYFRMKVRGYVDMVSQFKTIQGKNLKEQSEWALDFANYLLNFASVANNDSTPAERAFFSIGP